MQMVFSSLVDHDFLRSLEEQEGKFFFYGNFSFTIVKFDLWKENSVVKSLFLGHFTKPL